jgi:tetratricopeptide (TPR) repeat protein
MNVKRTLIVSILGAAIACLSCGDDGPSGPGEDASPLVSQGWTYFEDGQFDSARVQFEEALSIEPDLADAHNGLGWSILFLGLPPSNEPLDEAVTAFERAIDLELYAADPQVGLAIAHQAEGDYEAAVDYALEALDLEPTYSFRHRQSVNYLDVRIVLAQSYFHMGESHYPEAQAQVDILEPGNGLDPEDESSWRVDLDRDGQIESGETFGSYTEALMELIELLQRELMG